MGQFTEKTLGLISGPYALLAGIVIVFLIGTLPVIHHLVFGLRERKREIMCVLDDNAVRAYFNQFYHAKAETLNKNPLKELSRIYDQRFGMRSFILPLIVYIAALALAIVMIATVVGEHMPTKPTTALLSVVAAYGLAGAYLWVVSDLIGRYRQRNLVPSALYFAAFRIVISIPLAAALGAMIGDYSESAASSLAFLLGAFPTSTLFLIARRTVGKRLNLTDDPNNPDQPPELETLQGVNRPIAEAFSDIGVSTLVQLAYDDPIQLAMRTNLSFNFVLDIVSQALVAIYVDLKVCGKYSLRGSVETSSLAGRYFNEEQVAVRVVADLAAELKLSIEVIAVILFQIKEDPYCKFINTIWDRTASESEDGAAREVFTALMVTGTVSRG
jgi:hypothetical protein